MATPVLDNWRLIGGKCDALGILIGEVSGHPSLPNGWITTSPVAEVAGDRSWARTANRRYQLATPLPDDQPLPPVATDTLLSIMFRYAGELPSLEAVERLTVLADKLSEAPLKSTDQAARGMLS
jgi:hypothetical protein